MRARSKTGQELKEHVRSHQQDFRPGKMHLVTGCFCSVLAAVLIAQCVQAGRLHMLIEEDGTGQIHYGVVDPSSAQFEGTPVILPEAPEGCTWTVLEGKRGETYTSFYENSTFFFLGGQICDDSALLGSTGGVIHLCARTRLA